mgnify:CR=1 FL=1
MAGTEGIVEVSKYSVRVGHPEPASSPLEVQIVACFTVEGISKST